MKLQAIGACTALVLGICLNVSGRQLFDRSLFEFRAAQYGLDRWRGVTKERYSTVLEKFTLPNLNLACTNRNDFVTVFNAQPRYGKLIFSEVQAQNIFKIEYFVCEDSADAHDTIIDGFSMMTSTAVYGINTDVGDKCFYKTYGDWTSVVFARNNVVVEIRSEFDFINALDVAKQIDKEILKQSGVKTGQPSTSGGKKTVKPNERERKDNGKGN